VQSFDGLHDLSSYQPDSPTAKRVEWYGFSVSILTYNQ